MTAALENITAFARSAYEQMSTTDLLVYVATELERNGVRLTFEPIVVAVYRYFPEKFSLVGFPEYPDASRVNRTLLQCQPKYRNLLKGSASTQFVVTEAGREQAADVQRRLNSGGPVVRRARKAAPRAMLDRIEKEILSSGAFAAWKTAEQISEYDFYHLLHLLPGASNKSVRENFDLIKTTVQQSDDAAVKAFINDVEIRFIKRMQ